MECFQSIKHVWHVLWSKFFQSKSLWLVQAFFLQYLYSGCPIQFELNFDQKQHFCQKCIIITNTPSIIPSKMTSKKPLTNPIAFVPKPLSTFSQVSKADFSCTQAITTFTPANCYCSKAISFFTQAISTFSQGSKADCYCTEAISTFTPANCYCSKAISFCIQATCLFTSAN